MNTMERQLPSPIQALVMMSAIWLTFAASDAAATITAKVNTNNGASSDDDRQDPDVWWTGGTFVIDTTANATDPGGTMSAATRWPAAGTLPKAGLLVDVNPTTAGPGGTSIIPGGNFAPASGAAPDYAASGVKSPRGTAWGYSYGYAYLDTTLVDEYEMNVHAYAFGTLFVNDNGKAGATITDPFRFGWDDTENHTLISGWNMQPGTEVVVDQVGPELGSAEAGFTVTSNLDLYDSGGQLQTSQLFWRLSVSADSTGDRAVDLALGDDVFLFGNPLAGQELIDFITSEISSHRISDGWLSVSSPTLFPFAYTASTGAPGYIDYSYEVEGFADARAVPTPPTVALLGLGGLAIFFLRRRKWNLDMGRCRMESPNDFRVRSCLACID